MNVSYRHILLSALELFLLKKDIEGYQGLSIGIHYGSRNNMNKSSSRSQIVGQIGVGLNVGIPI